jgi:carbon storage regulator
MWLMSRSVGDSVMIGDDVVVTVVAVREDSVRLGITTPRGYSVQTEEIAREQEPTSRLLDWE